MHIKKLNLKKLNLLKSYIFYITLTSTFTVIPNDTTKQLIAGQAAIMSGLPPFFLININASDIKQGVQQVAELKAMLTPSPTSSNIWNYIENHKLLSCACITGTVYVYSLYKLTQLEHDFDQPNSISNWKSDCSLNDLLAADNSKLAQELELVIKEQYAIFFKAEIEREITAAQRYLKFCQYINFSKLARFYPIDQYKIKVIEARISRLNYLKGIFNQRQNSQTLYLSTTI